MIVRRSDIKRRGGTVRHTCRLETSYSIIKRVVWYSVSVLKSVEDRVQVNMTGGRENLSHMVASLESIKKDPEPSFLFQKKKITHSHWSAEWRDLKRSCRTQWIEMGWQNWRRYASRTTSSIGAAGSGNTSNRRILISLDSRIKRMIPVKHNTYVGLRPEWKPEVL